MKGPDTFPFSGDAIPAKPAKWIATAVAGLPPLAASISEATEVEWLVHDVIICRALPFTVLSVSPSPPGWNVLVRAGTHGMARFSVARGRPAAVRLAIQEALEDAR